MKEFFYTLYTKYYLPPTGAPHNRLFSPEHIAITLILGAFVYYMFKTVVKRKSMAFSEKVLRRSAAAMLGLEIFRISWNAYYHGLSLTSFRFDFCNQVCMVLPFIVLFNWKKAYPYIQELAMGGGFIVLIYPLWVFYDYAGFHLLALQSMVSHALMLLCGLVMPMATGIAPSISAAYKPMVGIGIICVVARTMSQITGVNYFLMLNARGLPVISNISYPWYWLLLGPFLWFLIYFGTFYLQKLYNLLLQHPRGAIDIYGPEVSHYASALVVRTGEQSLGNDYLPYKHAIAKRYRPRVR